MAVVIGAGVMGAHHARVYAELLELEAVVDVDEVRAKEIADRHIVPYYSSIDEMLEEVTPSAVSIAVPTKHHCKVASKCLAAGCQLLVEKPIAPTVGDAVLLLQEAKRYGKTLAVGYIERFNPAYRALKLLVDSGALGSITSIAVKRVGGIPRSADNVVMDLMTHDINLLTHLFGRRPVDARANNMEANGVVCSSQAMFDFGGPSATCEANWISPVKIRTITVTGTGGYCEVDMIKQQVTMFDRNLADSVSDFADLLAKYADPVERTIDVVQREPLREELIGFLEFCRTEDTSTIVTGQEALETLEDTWAIGKGYL